MMTHVFWHHIRRGLIAAVLASATLAFAGPIEDAEALAAAKRPKEAEAVYSRVLASKPGEVAALLGRAKVRESLGNIDDEAADLDQAIRVAPMNSEVWQRRAIFRLHISRDLVGALADCNHALALDPKSGAAYNTRGNVYFDQNRNEAALADYRESLRFRPEYANTVSNRCGVLIRLGRYDEALEDAGHALRLDPTNFNALNRRAWLRDRRGDVAGALADYRAVAAIDPKNPDALSRLPVLEKAAAGAPAPAATDVPAQAESILGAFDQLRSAVGDLKTAVKSPPQTATVQPAGTPYAAARPNSGGTPPSRPMPAAGRPVAATTATAASPSPAVAKAKVAVKSPPPPEPPKAVATVTASMARRPGYKLVSTEFPFTNGNGAYTSRSRDAGYHVRTQNGGEAFASDLDWSVPETIVPGEPARVRLVGGGNSFTGYAVFKVNSWFNWDRMLVAIRSASREDSEVRSDEFNLVIPDITQGGEKTVSKTRFRSAEIKKTTSYDGGFIGSKKTPHELPLEEVEKERQAWMNRDANSRPSGYADVCIVVGQYSSPLAVYTYRWTEDCGPAVADSGEADRVEIVASPAARKELRADGRDGLWLMARVVPKTGEPGATLQAATQGLNFRGAGEDAAWLDFGEPVVRNGWKMVYIQASNPDPVRGGSRLPASLVVQACPVSGRPVGELKLAVTPNAEIDAKPDFIDFASKSGQTADVKVWIDNPGDGPWQFRTEYADKNRALAVAKLSRTDSASAVVGLKEAGLDLQVGESNNEVAVLRIVAERKDRAPLERDIKIRVGQEGVFVLPTGRSASENCYVVQADGKGTPTDVDFRVFLRDATTQRLVNNKAAVEKLVVECLEPEGSVVMQALKTGQLQTAFAGIRAGNEPSGIFRFVFAKEIPGDGRMLKADFRVSYPGRAEETFATIITIGIATTSNGPGSAEWQLELDRCREVIHKFVPLAYNSKMEALLEKQKRTLGPEGLRELRNRIWRAAVELTLGEGGQGYANEAAWADRITTALEWTEWGGDMAFGVVIGTWTGPYGATGAGMLKSAAISAINAYQDGRSPDEWLWENVCTIPGLVEGKVIDPDTFEKLGAGSRAKAWALYIAYNFCKNLYKGETLVEALKHTAKEAGNNALAGWLNQKVGASAARAAADAKKRQTALVQLPTAAKAPAGSPGAAKKPAVAVAPGTPKKASTGEEPAARKPAGDAEVTKISETESAAVRTASDGGGGEAEAVRLIRGRMTERDGVPHASCEDVLTIMRDPSMVRALKTAPEEVQLAFSNTREAIYRQHDAQVVDYVRRNVPDMQYRMVKVMEFRTPGQKGISLNTDRDYRVCYYAGRDPGTGKERWIEVDRRKWEDHSYATFARLTGGPADNPAAAKHWAEQHQQLATDKWHPEASPAFSDQSKVWNASTRQFENTQILPNVLRVKAGQAGASLKDPQALGQMYRIKVADARFPHEAFVQAQKAVKELDAIMDGYLKQGRKVDVLPPKIIEGMATILRVNQQLAADPNRRNPAAVKEAAKALKASGFSSLDDFMNKLGAQFEALKNVPDVERAD